MIKLDSSVISTHPIMSRITNPPTHAKVASYRASFISAQTKVPTGATFPKAPTVEVVYEYGTLEDGIFVGDPIIEPVTYTISDTIPIMADPRIANPDLTDNDVLVTAYARHLNKVCGLANLLGAGTVPSPHGSPKTAIAVVGKPANYFREHDLDAYFSALSPTLLGTVV